MIANPTKVPLEDEIGYENVELRTLDVVSLYQGVGNGELDAFQDVWLPAHEDYVGEIEKDAELLGSWFRGTTRFGLGALSYMNITSIDRSAVQTRSTCSGSNPTQSACRRSPKTSSRRMVSSRSW